jgi:hypothetical protein
MKRQKMDPQELQAFLEFRRRGKAHQDRRKPRGKERSRAKRRSWELE